MGLELTGGIPPLLPFGLAGAGLRRRERPLFCIALTVAMVAAATTVRWLMGAGPAPFVVFYPAIIAASLLGGRPTGYLAVALSGLASAYLFLPPDNSFAVDRTGAEALALHAIVSLLAVEIVAQIGTRADLLEARTADLTRREAQASASLSEVEALYDNAPIGLGFLDREMRFLRINRTLAEMNGPSRDDHIGRSVWDILPNLRDQAEPALRRVLDHGETLTDIQLSGETPARPGEQRHWIEMFYPVRGTDGAVEGVGICCRDVTDIRQALDREHLLMREVDHRAKNLLTVVQSVLHLSRSAETVDDYRAAVTGRIQALGRVHTILADNRWDGVPLAELVAQELAPYGHGVDIDSDGAGVVLPPSPAQAISMILHELATNSAKHGALSGGGRVALQCQAGERIVLRWEEHGGPKVEPPTRNGFGTSLIQTAVKRLLSGTLDYRLEPDGLVCDISFPLPKPVAKPVP